MSRDRISNNVVCATSKASDQPAHTCSLIRAFCSSLEYSTSIMLLTDQHLGSLSLKGGCTGLSESTHVKIPHCLKSHVTAHMHKYQNLMYCHECIRLGILLLVHFNEKVHQSRRSLWALAMSHLTSFHLSLMMGRRRKRSWKRREMFPTCRTNTRPETAAEGRCLLMWKHRRVQRKVQKKVQKNMKVEWHFNLHQGN